MKDISNLDNVPRQTSIFVKRQLTTHNDSVIQFIHEHSCKNLEDRRKYIQLSKLYKIIHELANLSTKYLQMGEQLEAHMDLNFV